MSQQDVDNLKKTAEDTFEWTKAQLTKAEDGFNKNADVIAKNLRETLSYGLNQAGHARSQAEDVVATAQSHVGSAQNDVLKIVRDNVKQGVAYVELYPYAAWGAAAGLLMLFPGPRGFVSRNVFGILQSQESAFRGASEKFASVSEASATLLTAKEVASESASKALSDLKASRLAATEAHGKLVGIQTKLSSTLDQYEDVQARLRPLKHEGVNELRADAARERAEAASSYKEISRMVAQLTAAGA